MEDTDAKISPSEDGDEEPTTIEELPEPSNEIVISPNKKLIWKFLSIAFEIFLLFFISIRKIYIHH